MNTLLVWHIRAVVYRLVGVWERRGMRRNPPPPTPPTPPEGGARRGARPDPHTAMLRQRFATGAVPHGRPRPMDYQQYARIARAVRAEHEEGPNTATGGER